MTSHETTAAAAERILVAHQRMDHRGCLCGWSELGRSHPGHQVAVLAEAGLLAASPTPQATGWSFTFENHRGLVWRQDGRGCPVWYLGDADYERAHTEADTDHEIVNWAAGTAQFGKERP